MCASLDIFCRNKKCQYNLLIVYFSSRQCPIFRREADGSETPEPFAAEAKFFTESRLLQRDVQIILESCPNQIILGTILHPVVTAQFSSSGWLVVSFTDPVCLCSSVRMAT